MVLYSKCAYGSQFLGEENNLRIQSLVAEILSKNPVSFFLGHPVCLDSVWTVSGQCPESVRTESRQCPDSVRTESRQCVDSF